MSPAFKKNLTTTLIILAGFVLIASLFSLPAFTGKVLASSDIMKWKAVSQESHAWADKHGDAPLWSNSMFGGMPTYTFYGPRGNNYVRVIDDILTGFLPRPANFFFLAMLSFFLLSAVMKWNKWLGAIGAVGFAFATYNCVISATGHETKMLDIAYMPAVFAGLILLMRGRYLAGAALFGISFCLSMTAGHYQIIYYLLLTLFVTGLGLLLQAYRNGQLKTALIGGVIAAVMVGVGSGPVLGNILPTLEYAKQTQRGGASELKTHDQGKQTGGLDKNYAFGWSNGIGETFCILVPYLYGGSSMEDASRLSKTNEALQDQYPQLPAYWGPQPILMGPVYFGAVICFLFVLGMMLIRSNLKWWLLGISVFAILLSVGDNLKGFNYFMFDHLPGLNKFRAPSTALVIPQFLFPVIGIWGLNEVIRGRVSRDTFWQKAKIAAIAVGGLALVLGLLGSLFFDFTNKATDAQLGQILSDLKDDRISMARNSALLSACYIAASAGLIWLFSKDRIKTQALIGGLGLVIAIDLLAVGHNYLRDKPGDPNGPYKDKEEYESFFQPSAADQQILQDKDPYYRVLDVTGGVFSDAYPSYHHKSIGGYSAAKLENYQDLIDVQMSKGFNAQVMNMLNVKYFIVQNGERGPKGVIPNPAACGNAWFVNNIRWTRSAEEDINALNAPAIGDTAQAAGTFQPKETANIRETFRQALNGLAPGKDAAATITLTDYAPDALSFRSSSSSEGLGVFSDIYYDKGWTATIDGKATPIIKADYALRALRIPAGNHTIAFRFLPQSYQTGKTVALITSFVLLGLLLAWAYTFFRQRGILQDEVHEPTL